MRDPAIHVRRSDLIIILHKLGIYGNVNDIMREAVKVSIRNRVFITTKSRKKVERHIEAENQSVEQFNRIYMGVMLSNNIKVLTIGKNSPMFLTLKEVTCQAIEFCRLFNLDHEIGFKDYVETGLKLLNRKYSLYRLKSYGPKVVEYYSDMVVIANDISPDKTNQMITAWGNSLIKYFGETGKSIHIEGENNRAHFIYAKEDADFYEASYTDWMNAQFEKWQYLNSIPAYTQLHGDNAKLAYGTYCAKSNKEYTGETEKQYFKNREDGKKLFHKEDIEKEAVLKARLQASLQRTGQTDNGAGGTD